MIRHKEDQNQTPIETGIARQAPVVNRFRRGFVFGQKPKVGAKSALT